MAKVEVNRRTEHVDVADLVAQLEKRLEIYEGAIAVFREIYDASDGVYVYTGDGDGHECATWAERMGRTEVSMVVGAFGEMDR